MDATARPLYKAAKLQVNDVVDAMTSEMIEFRRMMNEDSLRIFDDMSALQHKIYHSSEYRDPEHFVKGLLKYCLHLVSLLNKARETAEGSFIAREAAANTVPDFLLSSMEIFKNRLSDSIREHGRAKSAQLIHSAEGESMLTYDAEGVLCLRALLTTRPRWECYRRTQENICFKFVPYQVIIKRFLVSFTLVKRLVDVIHSFDWVYSQDGKHSEVILRAIKGELEFSNKKLRNPLDVVS